MSLLNLLARHYVTRIMKNFWADIILVIVIIVVTYCATTAANRNVQEITVTPDNNTHCPSTECFTLEELIDSGNLTTDIIQEITILFLPGTHIISERISNRSKGLRIEKKKSLEFSAKYSIRQKHTHADGVETYPVIEYTGRFFFVFMDIQYVTISELTFKSISEPYVDQPGETYLFFPQCITITMSEKVTVLRISTIGTGLMVDHSSYVNMFDIKLLRYTITDLKYDLFVESIDKSIKVTNLNCGSIFIYRTISFTFYGDIRISNNKGEEAFSMEESRVDFVTHSVAVISNNTYITGARDTSIVSIINSVFVLEDKSIVRIENNTASGCGGMSMVKSVIEIGKKSALIFSGNKGGTNGGALALYQGSAVQFITVHQNWNDLAELKSGKINFINNRAGKKGGAIYVDDSGYIKNNLPIIPTVNCLYEYAIPNFYFSNNTAKVAGDEIFGGWLEWPFSSEIKEISSNASCDTELVLSNLKTYNDLSTVSSNPVRVCMCDNAIPNCNITRYNVTLYPGQTLELEAVAVGQRFGTVPSTVLAEYVSTNSAQKSLGHFERGQNIQSVGRYCTPLQYTVMSLNCEETIYLHPDNVFAVPNLNTGCDICTVTKHEKQRIFSESPELELLFSNFTISVELLNCPLGYLLVTGKCTCHPTLLNNGLTCNTNDYSIHRPQRKWINATFEHTVENTDYGILVHNNCPLDYCYNKDTNMNLENPQDQCDFNRSDILCGACQNNFSHVFGTSRCKKCSNLWVLLIVPTVILAGIALVAFLMILNLTVSIGTINGLIFYANIVRANQAVFFPTKEANTFLNIFIAWLNLDLGVETCFYDGLNAYTKTWLQFIFPFYIWLLVSLIIISSHYSSTVSRWSGSNAVQVLATLFLLSYVKLLQLIITVFLNTTITYPDGYTKRVWLYDGNVDFLKGEHIPLFIAALLTLVILTVPYTTTLITIQWLQRHKSCKRALFWVHKFKPIFDAHTGPYKSKHRYWTGLLLLVRACGTLAGVPINLSGGDPSVDLLAITVTILCLSMYFQFIGGPYRSKMINLVEISFYFNTCILSTTTIYRLKIESSSTVVTTISTSIAFVIFTLIVLYHAVERITETRRGAKLKHSIVERATALAKQSAPVINITTGQGGPVGTLSEVSHSSIELKEPLLANVVQVKQD